MFERVTLERRADTGALRSALVYVIALAVATTLSLGVMIAAGVPTGALFEELVVQVFLSEAGLARTVTMATPMILAALAAALCLRLKFWNIGIEGQLIMGAILATAVALYDIGGAGAPAGDAAGQRPWRRALGGGACDPQAAVRGQ